MRPDARHTYRVRVWCRGVIDDRGMIIDYAEIAEKVGAVLAMIDHRVLNEVPGWAIRPRRCWRRGCLNRPRSTCRSYSGSKLRRARPPVVFLSGTGIDGNTILDVPGWSGGFVATTGYLRVAVGR